LNRIISVFSVLNTFLRCSQRRQATNPRHRQTAATALRRATGRSRRRTSRANNSFCRRLWKGGSTPGGFARRPRRAGHWRPCRLRGWRPFGRRLRRGQPRPDLRSSRTARWLSFCSVTATDVRTPTSQLRPTVVSAMGTRRRSTRRCLRRRTTAPPNPSH